MAKRTAVDFPPPETDEVPDLGPKNPNLRELPPVQDNIYQYPFIVYLGNDRQPFPVRAIDESEAKSIILKQSKIRAIEEIRCDVEFDTSEGPDPRPKPRGLSR